MPDTAETQNKQIAAWLNDGLSLTALDSLRMFGCMRLASRIHELRKKGMPIEKTMIESPGGARIGCYFISQPNLRLKN